VNGLAPSLCSASSASWTLSALDWDSDRTSAGLPGGDLAAGKDLGEQVDPFTLDPVSDHGGIVECAKYLFSICFASSATGSRLVRLGGGFRLPEGAQAAGLSRAAALRAVERVPSASRVNLGALEPKPPKKPETPAKTPDMEGKDPFAIAQMLYSRMLDDLLTKSEDVGKEFPAEARKIYYQEVPARAIRGQAPSRSTTSWSTKESRWPGFPCRRPTQLIAGRQSGNHHFRFCCTLRRSCFPRDVKKYSSPSQNLRRPRQGSLCPQFVNGGLSLHLTKMMRIRAAFWYRTALCLHAPKPRLSRLPVCESSTAASTVGTLGILATSWAISC